MKTYDVSEIEAMCYEIIDEIAESQERVLVTKDGQPYVLMRPFAEPSQSLIETDEERSSS